LQNLASWQAEFDGVDIFAFDESSMMGRATVGRIIYRLDEIKGKCNYSILFTGDAMQLPPVNQLPMWAKDPVQGEGAGAGSDNDAAVGAGGRAQKKSKHKGKQREDKVHAHGYASYQARFEEHATVFVLRDSFRQQSDPAFRDEVMRLRQEPKVTQFFKKDSHGNATSYKLKKPKVALDFGTVQHGYWASKHLANLCAQGDDGAFDDALRMFDVNSVKNPKANLWNESKFRRLVVLLFTRVLHNTTQATRLGRRQRLPMLRMASTTSICIWQLVPMLWLGTSCGPKVVWSMAPWGFCDL
jgi:hypothetical protein